MDPLVIRVSDNPGPSGSLGTWLSYSPTLSGGGRQLTFSTDFSVTVTATETQVELTTPVLTHAFTGKRELVFNLDHFTVTDNLTTLLIGENPALALKWGDGQNLPQLNVAALLPGDSTFAAFATVEVYDAETDTTASYKLPLLAP